MKLTSTSTSLACLTALTTLSAINANAVCSAAIPAAHQRLQPPASHPAGCPMGQEPPGSSALAQALLFPSTPFARKCTPADLNQLVAMDKAHESVCGRPKHTCCSVLTRCMALRVMNAWQSCHPRTCTTCAKVLASSTNAPVLQKTARYAIPLVCAKRSERVARSCTTTSLFLYNHCRARTRS